MHFFFRVNVGKSANRCRVAVHQSQDARILEISRVSNGRTFSILVGRLLRVLGAIKVKECANAVRG